MTTSEKNRANQVTRMNDRMAIRESGMRIIKDMTSDGFLLEDAEAFLQNIINEIVIAKAAALHEKMIKG